MNLATSTIALAALTMAVCLAAAPADQEPAHLIPARWSLVYTTEGEAYVQDFNLSSDDCRTFKQTASQTARNGVWTCEIQ